MTERGRQNWNTAGMFTIAVALMGIGAGIWNLAAGFTTATSQHERIFQQNAQIFQMMQQNSDEQLKVLRRIEEKLDNLNTKTSKK